MKKTVFALGLMAAFGAQAALFVNGEAANGLGLSVVKPGQTYFGYFADTAGSRVVADDFTVGASGWTVEAIDFFAYQTGATSFTFTDVSWKVISGANINLGSVVASGTTVVTDAGPSPFGHRVHHSDLTNTDRPIYRINADMPDFSLSAGQYWLSWSFTGDSALTEPLVAPSSDDEIGNAVQRIGDGAPFDALTNGSDGVTLPFLINGQVNAVPEPSTYALLALGLAAVAGVARRRNKA